MSKGEDTRQVILDRALDLASTEGLGQLSIGMLAHSVGMSKSGLFAHFKSKEQLQLDVIDETSGRFVARVIAPALRQPRGEARLRAFFDGWMAWERGEFPGGCIFQSAAVELDDRPGPVRDRLLSSQRDLLDTIATIVRQGGTSGAFRADVDPGQVAFELVAILGAYHRFHRLFQDPAAEAHARSTFESLIARIRVAS